MFAYSNIRLKTLPLLMLITAAGILLLLVFYLTWRSIGRYLGHIPYFVLLPHIGPTDHTAKFSADGIGEEKAGIKVRLDVVGNMSELPLLIRMQDIVSPELILMSVGMVASLAQGNFLSTMTVTLATVYSFLSYWQLGTRHALELVLWWAYQLPGTTWLEAWVEKNVTSGEQTTGR